MAGRGIVLHPEFESTSLRYAYGAKRGRGSINLVYTQLLPKNDLGRGPNIRPGDRLKPLQGTVFRIPIRECCQCRKSDPPRLDVAIS
jgi:hypothetical protein